MYFLFKSFSRSGFLMMLKSESGRLEFEKHVIGMLGILLISISFFFIFRSLGRLWRAWRWAWNLMLLLGYFGKPQILRPALVMATRHFLAEQHFRNHHSVTISKSCYNFVLFIFCFFLLVVHILLFILDLKWLTKAWGWIPITSSTFSE